MLFVILGIFVVIILVAPMEVKGPVVLFGLLWLMHLALGRMPEWMWLAAVVVVPLVLFLISRRSSNNRTTL